MGFFGAETIGEVVAAFGGGGGAKNTLRSSAPTEDWAALSMGLGACSGVSVCARTSGEDSFRANSARGDM